MDTIRIEPKMLKGRVAVPPSKSVAHRALIAAALSGGECRVDHIALSADIQATIGCLRAMGAKCRMNTKEMRVNIAPKVSKAAGNPLELDCGESGSTLRFFMPLALLHENPVIFRGHGRLMQRPQKPYFDLFQEQGIQVERDQDTIRLSGKLHAGIFSLPGDVSSQFITGLLFTLPLLDGDSEIRVTTELESKGYVDLTLSVLQDFGVSVINDNYRVFRVAGNQRYVPMDYRVESDYSQAAFFLVAGALGCDVICDGLRKDSLQGDKAILDILRQAGALVEELPDGGVRAKRAPDMHGIVIDAREIPDLVPILAVLCAFCPGESRIVNAGRLRIKESDRLEAISSELKHLGARITEGSDYLMIQGIEVLEGRTCSAWNDHRIAMATAIAACRCEGSVAILGAGEAVKKSYPDFFRVYEGLSRWKTTFERYPESRQ